MQPMTRHIAGEQRYELAADGQVLGHLEYVDAGDHVVVTHTVIASSQRGRGLGAVLVAAALDDLRSAGRLVVPQCWYVAQFIDEHPAYRDLVAH